MKNTRAIKMEVKLFPLLCVIAVLLFAGCEAAPVPRYIISRSANGMNYNTQNIPGEVDAAEYESSIRKSHWPGDAQGMQWNPTGKYKKVYQNKADYDEWMKTIDPFLCNLYIWYYPYNKGKTEEEQMQNSSAVLSDELYSSILKNGYFNVFQSDLKKYSLKVEPSTMDLLPYAKQYWNESGEEILCLMCSGTISLMKIGEYEIDDASYSLYPYFHRGDNAIKFYLYINQKTHKIECFEERYVDIYHSRFFSPHGVAANDVYPGYSHYLSHIEAYLSEMTDYEKAQKQINQTTELFLQCLYGNNDNKFDKEKIYSFCTDSLRNQLEEEGFVDVHQDEFQSRKISTEYIKDSFGFVLPKVAYTTVKQDSVILYASIWECVISADLPLGLSGRDHCFNPSYREYRTTFFLKLENGQYLIDEFFTEIY